MREEVDFIILADASHAIGWGHLTRVLTLAEFGKGESLRPMLLAAELDSQAADLVESKGVAYEKLQDPSVGRQAEETIEAARTRGARWVFTDICHARWAEDPTGLAAYHGKLLEEGLYVAAISDGMAHLPASLLVAPYVGAEESFTGSRCLAGPDYFLLPSAFLAFRGQRARVARRVKHLLITLGGADPDELTPGILRTVLEMGLSGLRVRVVVGGAFSSGSRAEIHRLADAASDCRALLAPGNLAEELAWADVAVIGDGLTKYEAAFMGVPGIIVPRSKSPQDLNSRFEREGTAVLLKSPPEKTLKSVLSQVIYDYPLRKRMATNGRRLVDGKGAMRIFESIPRELFRHASV